VRDTAITLAEVDVLCSYWTQRRTPEAQGVANRRELQLRAADYLIEQVLLAQEAEKRGIAASDSLVDQRLGRWEGQFPDPTVRDQALAERGMTREQLREEFRRDLLVQALVRTAVADTVQVPDADVPAYYAAHPEYFDMTEVHARHILKRIDPTAAPESLAAARATVADLRQRVLQGEDFDALARQHSDCPSKAQGGDLGFFTRGRMVPPFSEAAFALAPGQVSDVVQTDFGFHVIKVEERRNEGGRPLEEVAPAIRQYLRNQRIQEAVDALAQQLRPKGKVKMMVKA
jgi:peptidyl-prolyl cis-trans isomerase C